MNRANRFVLVAGVTLAAVASLDPNFNQNVAPWLQPEARALVVTLSKVDPVGALLQPGDRP